MPDEKAAAVWSDPDAPASCLLALGLDRYRPDPGEGPEASPIHWAPDTWRHHVADDCGVEIPARALDRLMAACVLLQYPHEFYGSVEGFSALTSALAGVWFEPDVWHPPSAEEVLWALIEAHLMCPPDEGDVFSPEVVRYVNMLVRAEGFRHMPPAFATFGVATDPAVWGDGPAVDYSEDPATALAVEEAASDRERDLDADTADRLRDLATRIRTLPVSGDRDGVAVELTRYADQIAADAPAQIDA